LILLFSDTFLPRVLFDVGSVFRVYPSRRASDADLARLIYTVSFRQSVLFSRR